MSKKKRVHQKGNKAAKPVGGRGKGAFTKMAASIAAGFMALQLYAGSLKADGPSASSVFGLGEQEIALLLSQEEPFGSDDLNAFYNAEKATHITFAPNGITVSGEGATVQGNRVNILAGGTYVLSGEANATVASSVKADKVRLVFDGLKLYSSFSPPIALRDVNKTVITLNKGTENVLIYDESEKFDAQIAAEGYCESVDGANNDGAYRAALWAENDLSVNGQGLLSVNAVQGNAITAGGTLKVVDAALNLQANKDGVVGQNGVHIQAATLTVKAGGTGIATALNSSSVQIEQNSAVKIMAAEDGIAAKNSVRIGGGYLAVAAQKACIRAQGSVCVTGGTVLLHGSENGSDGTVACVGTFSVTGGLLLCSGACNQTLPENAAAHAVVLDFSHSLSSGTLTYVSGGDGEVLAAFAPQNFFRTVLLYSPELNKNQTFSVYTGGIAAGGGSDGLYDSASGGNLFLQFTL